MLGYSDLKKGTLFVLDGHPYEVLDSSFSRMQQRKAVMQTKIRNLKTGKIVERNFQPSDTFEEANVVRRPLQFLYHHRGEYVFADPADPKKRMTLNDEAIGEKARWLVRNTQVTVLEFNDETLQIILPIKLDVRVIASPPGITGDRATSGTKSATVETGVTVAVPPFINAGDTIRINTETGAYVERVEKS